jgi:hypothetical protein
VITRAVLYNGDVKVAGYEPAINAQRVIEQIGAFDPAIFTTARSERTDSGLGTAGIGGNQIAGFLDRSVTNSISTGIRQRMPTGGGPARLRLELEPDQQSRRPRHEHGGNTRFWQNQLRLEVTQPLLRELRPGHQQRPDRDRPAATSGSACSTSAASSRSSCPSSSGRTGSCSRRTGSC